MGSAVNNFIILLGLLAKIKHVIKDIQNLKESVKKIIHSYSLQEGRKDTSCKSELCLWLGAINLVGLLELKIWQNKHLQSAYF